MRRSRGEDKQPADCRLHAQPRVDSAARADRVCDARLATDAIDAVLCGAEEERAAPVHASCAYLARAAGVGMRPGRRV